MNKLSANSKQIIAADLELDAKKINELGVKLAAGDITPRSP